MAANGRNMQILFVHGMGRSRLSGLPMLLHLKRQGFRVSAFGYSTARHSFAEITRRLDKRIRQIADQGEYALVGHSLGGVMIRQVLGQLPADCRQPVHVFLIASPVRSARLARHFQRSPVFRALTRDCGHLLSDDIRMQQVPPLAAPATSIVGTTGPTGKLSPFGDQANDGVVAVSETRAQWLNDEIQLPQVHTLLPASRRVAEIISRKLQTTYGA